MNLDNNVADHWDGQLVGERFDFDLDHWVHLPSLLLEEKVAVDL